MTLAYVGLGANIGDPLRHLQSALEELKSLPRTRVTASSGIYRSAPLGYASQPDFLNCVAKLDTELGPEELLAGLMGLEQLHGRERSFANAPRTLDLDLLLHGSEIRSTPQLTLPHPRMHERAFVLKPLLELAPQIEIPGQGAARELLPGLQDQRLERIG